MADNIAGLSTLGIKVYQALSEDGAKVTDAGSYSQLTRINSIGEVGVTTETIDASALEDMTSRFVAGRGSVTDTLDIIVNVTNETIAEWNAIKGKTVCIMIDVPGLSDGFFIIVQVPNKLSMPPFDQNGLLTMTIGCTVNDYIGLDTKVEVGEA